LSDNKIAGYAKAYAAVNDEINRYWKIRKELSNTTAEKDMPKQFVAYKDIARNLDQRFKSIAPAYTEIRQEPICVVLTGISDTGKTTNHCPAISKALLRHKNFSYYNNVYFPCKSSQYWTGYSPESSWVTVFDDAAPLKMAEIATDPALHPYAKFMDLINTCNVTLDQAAIADKGMKFTSEIVLVSNNAEVDTTSFATPAAILNRMIQVEVIPKSEFVFLEDVHDAQRSAKNAFYENGRPIFPTKPEYYYNPTHALQEASKTRKLRVNKKRLIKHVRQAEAMDCDEFERSVAIMDYCVFKVKKGKFPAYFSSGGRRLIEGDVMDSRTFLTLLDDEYKRLESSYLSKEAECAATQDKLDMEEFIGNLKQVEQIEPFSMQSSLKDFINYAAKEISEFNERYHIDTKTLIKIAALVAAIMMLLVALHKYFTRQTEEEEDTTEFVAFCEEFDIPLAQNEIYEKSKKVKSAAYRPSKIVVKKPTKWHARSQGDAELLVGGIHTTFKETMDVQKDLTEVEYDDFFEYPPMEEEPDIMLQYVSKQQNQEFRKKYITKGAILMYQPGKERAMCKAIAVKDKIVAIPHHMMPFLERGFEIQTLSQPRILIKPEEFIEIGFKDDKCLIELTRLPFSFPTFMNNFVSEKDLADVVSCQPQLLVPSTINKHFVMMVASMCSAEYKVQEFNYLKPGTTTETMGDDDYWLKLPRYLYYSCTNAAGYCGSPLVGTAGAFAGKMIGMHIAGNNNMSYATIISKEDILEMLSQSQGLVDYRTEKCMPFPQCRESSMKRSKFYKEISNEFGVKKIPPMCKIYKSEDGDLIEPCQSKLDAFHELKNGLIDLDIDRIVREELTHEPRSVGKPLTDEETLFGFGRLNSMDMSTAIGYYLMANDTRTKIAGEGKRKQYFPHKRMNGSMVYPSGWPMVQRIISERLEILKTKPLQTEYIASPKTNEALKPGKDVRLFYVGDVITLFMVRKYFGDLISDVMSENVSNEMAIGVNPYSFDWKRIINHLTCFEKANYNDGDVSGMEYNMYFPEVKESIIKATMGFYRNCNNEDNVIRENLIRSLFNCRVIWDGYFHDGMTFNPSGHPLTTYFNCMVIRYWKRYTYYTVQLETIGSLIEYPYAKWNRLIVMGDDSVEATHESIKDWYLPGEAAKVAKRFGITVTTAVKDTNFTPKDTLQECDFLKRKFDMTKHGVPIPKLEQTSIETSLLYVKGRHSSEARNSCVDAALCEAYYHGKEYFYRVRDTIMRAKKRIRLSDLIVHDYNYYAQRQAEAYCSTEGVVNCVDTYAGFF
jgi:hypothetical protein